MEISNQHTKSIFDIIEERSGNPQVFSWKSNDISLYNFTEEEYIYDGYLINIHKDPPKACKRKYILTVHGLIKFKVKINFLKRNMNIEI